MLTNGQTLKGRAEDVVLAATLEGYGATAQASPNGDGLHRPSVSADDHRVNWHAASRLSDRSDQGRRGEKGALADEFEGHVRLAGLRAAIRRTLLLEEDAYLAELVEVQPSCGVDGSEIQGSHL